MNISEQEFLLLVDDILEAMDKNNFGIRQKDVMASYTRLKAESSVL